MVGYCFPWCLVDHILDRLEENTCLCSAMAAMRTKLRLLTGIRVSQSVTSCSGSEGRSTDVFCAWWGLCCLSGWVVVPQC